MSKIAEEGCAGNVQKLTKKKGAPKSTSLVRVVGCGYWRICVLAIVFAMIVPVKF